MTNRLFVKSKMHPGMTDKERRAEVQAAAINSTLRRQRRLWLAIVAQLAPDGPALSGWVRLAVVEEKAEEGDLRVFRMKWREPVHDVWNVPTLVADAVLDPHLVRRVWPQAELTATVRAITPHQHVTQVPDAPTSQNKLIDDPPRDNDDDLFDKKRRRRKLRDLLCAQASQTNGDVLVIAQKGLWEAFAEEKLTLPDHVSTAHFGAISGRDTWGPNGKYPGYPGVALVIIVGRTSPKARDVQRAAEAMGGAAVDPISGTTPWLYPRVPAWREMGDGTYTGIEVDQHPDPLAESLRWQTCEGQNVQGVGRGRGANRTAQNPLKVLILNNLPLPFPVDEVVSYASIAATPADVMLDQGGVDFECPGHAAVAYPERWRDESAVRAAWRGMVDAKAQRTRRSRTALISKTLYRPCTTPASPVRCRYKPAGRGGHEAVAWFLPALIQDVRSRIEELLKLRLAYCEVDEPVEEQEMPEPATEPTVEPPPPTHIVSSAMAMPTEFSPEPVVTPFAAPVVQRQVGGAHAARGPP